MTKANLITIENGGVSSAKGFRAGGIHAGFRDDPNRLDMALVEADELCPAAGVFTRNVFCAAPVTVSREHLDGVGYGFARAMVINSGIANAATGSGWTRECPQDCRHRCLNGRLHARRRAGCFDGHHRPAA